jgi:diaminopimelate epimerase
MHGCSNDFVVVDGHRHAVPDPAALARAISARRTGVGSDGLLLALPGRTTPLRMRVYNADGSEAEMCGNGLRCLVKYAVERGLVPPDPHGRVETQAGILAYEAEVLGTRPPQVGRVTIRMGVPRLERSEIPMRGPAGRVVEQPLSLAPRPPTPAAWPGSPGRPSLSVTAVSLGNPHAVAWVEDVEAFPVPAIGPLVENHPDFPCRTNVEFAEVVSPGEVRQRTWERGCGETLACGTGACAVVVAGVLTGRTARRVRVRLRGGDLEVAWPAEDEDVLLAGPAQEVYSGTWPLPVAG